MQSLTFFGLSFPLLPFLGLTALVLIATSNTLLPGTVAGLTDRLISRVFVALLASRAVYVAVHWSSYDDLFSIIDIRDRGFHALTWAAVFGVGIAQLFYQRANERRRLAILVCMAAIWVAAGYISYRQFNQLPEQWPTYEFQALSMEHSTTKLPIQSFDDLNSDAPGRTLVNLWATWCPSCRTEMPALQRAQARHPEVRFILINQGETEQQVRDYLLDHDYRFHHVWLDPRGDMGRWLGQGALPVTLLFDEKGSLIDGHTGVISDAIISDLLSE